MSGDGDAEREDRAAEIERIARVGVGPRDREHFLFVQMACRQGAHEQPDASDERAVREYFAEWAEPTPETMIARG